MPELAFFDCHACHRPMKNPHWAFRESSGLEPGTIHVNDANLIMLRALLRNISPGQGERLHAAMIHLHQAASVSLPDATKAAEAMRPLLAEIRKTVVQRQFSSEDILLEDSWQAQFFWPQPPFRLGMPPRLTALRWRKPARSAITPTPTLEKVSHICGAKTTSKLCLR